MRLTRTERLEKRIRDYQRAPQSVEREKALTLLQLELDELLATRTIRVIARTRLLLDAYTRTGSMSVIYPSGQTRTERPAYADHPVQHYWNVKYLARDLAHASIPYE